MYTIKEAEIKDVPLLVSILKSWEEFEILHNEVVTEESFIKAIKEGDLPPIDGASKENYHTKIVYIEDQPIGYFGYYEGYPNKETVWIAIFVIDQAYRKQSHGKNLYLRIEDSMKEVGYKNIALGVHSKNIYGLHFWFNLGFREITKVRLEKDYAVMGLNKPI